MRATSRSSANTERFPRGTNRIVRGLAGLVYIPVLSLALWGANSDRPLPVLTHGDEIRHLTTEQAALGYPVRIRGVVTDDVPAPDFFVQDSKAGVYVEGSKTASFTHHFGDLIEVEGVTGPGKFAPVIIEQRSRVLGKAHLPTTRLYTFDELSDGQLDSQWVKIRGIVRSVSIDRSSWSETALAMRIASGGGQISVRVPISAEQNFSSWIDSEVLLEGVCGSLVILLIEEDLAHAELRQSLIFLEVQRLAVLLDGVVETALLGERLAAGDDGAHAQALARFEDVIVRIERDAVGFGPPERFHFKIGVGAADFHGLDLGIALGEHL